MSPYRPVTIELLKERCAVSKTGCWEWTAGLSGIGYGQISRDGYPALAHRVMVELTRGPLPPKSVVMHVCDNKRCINPDHLAVASQAANVLDMFRKKLDGRSIHPNDRWPRGSRVGTSKLTEAQVAEIRQLLRAGHSQRTIAARFAMSRRTIQFISKGTTWRHVA